MKKILNKKTDYLIMYLTTFITMTSLFIISNWILGYIPQNANYKLMLILIMTISFIPIIIVAIVDRFLGNGNQYNEHE
jgi:ABC-type transport system involved in cytochrome bd biosynthesis fused ATPase/permease subunit